MAKLNQLFKQFNKNKAMKELKLQRMKHILKKNSLYKFQMLCPILLLLKEGEEVEFLVEVLHQEEIWLEDEQGDL